MVNLAMNLSASRRRQVTRVGSLGMGMGMGRSGANTPHPRQPSWPATASLNTPAPTTPTDAARHFPKRASTSTAATGATAATSETLPPIPGAVTVPVALPDDPLRHTASMQDELMNMELSDATLARADKARQHFELFAEYLRLLSHLPPLPPAEDTDTQPQRDGDGDAHGNPRGRTYNPLQYIRNRKVRFREKCPIDSTAEGWDDVGQVRRWVENVASNRPNTRLSVTDCLELPDVLMAGPNDGGRVLSGPAAADHDHDHAKGDRHATGTPLQSSISGISGETKLRRPRVDWITNPADLIADAAWLERAGNKLKIEDRDGNKLFPRGTRFGRVKLRNAPPTPTPTPGRATGADRHTPARAASASASPSSPSQKSRSRAQSRGRSRGRARTRPGERSRSAESDSSGSDEPSTLARLKSKVRTAAARGRSESTLSHSLPDVDDEEEEEEEDSGMESDEDVGGARAESRRRKRRLRRRVRGLSHRSPTGREGFEDSLGLLDKLALKGTASCNDRSEPSHQPFIL
ncbi:hypothetical protein KEM55_006842, partial [Ascosphaera atra]